MSNHSGTEELRQEVPRSCWSAACTSSGSDVTDSGCSFNNKDQRRLTLPALGDAAQGELFHASAVAPALAEAVEAAVAATAALAVPSPCRLLSSPKKSGGSGELGSSFAEKEGPKWSAAGVGVGLRLQ